MQVSPKQFSQSKTRLREKQSKALKALNILRNSGDWRSPSEFARVAEQYSECSTAKRGGDLGWLPRGEMVGAYSGSSLGVEPGTIGDIFRSSEGYHIVLVEGRRN